MEAKTADVDSNDDEVEEEEAQDTESEPEEQSGGEGEEDEEEMDTAEDSKARPKSKKKRQAPRSKGRRKGKKPPANEDPLDKKAREAKLKVKSKKTAYQFFQKDQRDNHKENMSKEFGANSKRLGDLWKATTADARKPFEAMAVADKKRFKEEFEAWQKLYPEYAAKEEKEKHEAAAKKPKKARKRKAASRPGAASAKKKRKGQPQLTRVHIMKLGGPLNGIDAEDLLDNERPPM